MIKITDDVFDIASRIKSINPLYELYFDKKEQKFKVYIKGSCQLILPFDSLDSRAVDYTLKTQVKNLEKIQDEVDNHNKKLFKARQNELKEQRLQQFEKVEKIIKD